MIFTKFTLFFLKKITLVSFNDTLIEFKRWNHIVVVHSKSVFTSPSLSLYVNGMFCGTKSAPFVTSSEKKPVFIFGRKSEREEFEKSFSFEIPQNITEVPLYDIVSNDQKWNLGTTYLIEEVMTHEMITTLYFLGFNYCSNFRASFKQYQTFDIFNANNLKLILNSFYSNNPQSVGPTCKPLSLANSWFYIQEEKIVFSLNAKNYYIDVVTEKTSLPPHSPLLTKYTFQPLNSMTTLNEDTTRNRNVLKNEIFKIINSVSPPLPVQFVLPNLSTYYRQNSALLDGARPYVITSFSTLLRRMGGISIIFHLISKSNSSNFLSLLKLLVSSIKNNFWVSLELSSSQGENNFTSQTLFYKSF